MAVIGATVPGVRDQQYVEPLSTVRMLFCEQLAEETHVLILWKGMFHMPLNLMNPAHPKLQTARPSPINKEEDSPASAFFQHSSPDLPLPLQRNHVLAEVSRSSAFQYLQTGDLVSSSTSRFLLGVGKVRGPQPYNLPRNYPF